MGSDDRNDFSDIDWLLRRTADETRSSLDREALLLQREQITQLQRQLRCSAAPRSTGLGALIPFVPRPWALVAAVSVGVLLVLSLRIPPLSGGGIALDSPEAVESSDDILAWMQNDLELSGIYADFVADAAEVWETGEATFVGLAEEQDLKQADFLLPAEELNENQIEDEVYESENSV